MSSVKDEFVAAIGDGDLATLLNALVTHGAEHVLDELVPEVLRLAAQMNKPDVFRAVLAVTDVAAGDTLALHVAAKHGHLEIVRLLVDEYGVCVSTVDSRGNVPIAVAARGGHTDVVEFLVSAGACAQCAAVAAAEKNRVALARWLIEHTDVNLTGRPCGSQPPLHTAARNGHVAMLRLFVEEFGCDPDAKYNDLAPVLHAGICAQYEALVWLLHEAHVDPNVRYRGSTFVHYLASRGRLDFLRELAAAGADIDVCDEFGHTPMAVSADVDTARWLADEHGLGTDTPNCEGVRPVHIAAEHTPVEVVRWFVEERGADPRGILRAAIAGTAPANIGYAFEAEYVSGAGGPWRARRDAWLFLAAFIPGLRPPGLIHIIAELHVLSDTPPDFLPAYIAAAQVCDAEAAALLRPHAPTVRRGALEITLPEDCPVLGTGAEWLDLLEARVAEVKAAMGPRYDAAMVAILEASP